jgi:SPP1 gp7 family putative phage head morphogenesis protein
MKASKESLSTFLKSADGWFDKREAKIRADAAKGQSIMEKKTLKMFADMAATIIGTTKKFLKEKSWDQHIATKAEDGQPKASLVKKNELRRRLRNALDKFESAWIDDYREALVARVDVGYNAALDVPFNMPSKTEIAGLRARGRSVREDALEERAGRVFSYMNETTIGRVFRTIENGIDEGKTVQQIADSLRDKFSEVEEIGARAMMIARTETLTAVSLGQAAAMADAATIVPDLQKMWLTAKDERVRDSHEELDGDIVPWDGTFDNGLKFPRDPAGEAADVVNCRCAMLIVPKDQMSEIDSGLLASDETKE